MRQPAHILNGTQHFHSHSLCGFSKSPQVFQQASRHGWSLYLLPLNLDRFWWLTLWMNSEGLLSKVWKGPRAPAGSSWATSAGCLWPPQKKPGYPDANVEMPKRSELFQAPLVECSPASLERYSSQNCLAGPLPHSRPTTTVRDNKWLFYPLGFGEMCSIYLHI